MTYTVASGDLVPNVLVYDLADGIYTPQAMTVRMNQNNISIRDVVDRKGDHNICVYEPNL